MRIIKDTNIQFMSQYKLGAFLSGAVIILGIISLILAGGPLLSIDFKGGTLIAVHFEEPVDVNEFRSAMSNGTLTMRANENINSSAYRDR